MKARAVGVAVITAGLALSGAGLAFAGEARLHPMQDLPSCSDANKSVDALQVRLDVALKDEKTSELAAVEDAKVKLAAAVAKTVQYNKNVYPGDVVPTVDQITPDLLKKVLGDADLGGGARAEVEAALAAFDVLAKAQAALKVDNQVVADIRVLLSNAVTTRDKVCTPGTVTVTPSAPPPNVIVVPDTSDGVDTGDGSLSAQETALS